MHKEPSEWTKKWLVTQGRNFHRNVINAKRIHVTLDEKEYENATLEKTREINRNS